MTNLTPPPEPQQPGTSPYYPSDAQQGQAGYPQQGYPQSGYQQQAPGYYQGQPGYYPPAYTRPTDGVGIAAFVTGLLGLGIVAVILGHVSLSRIKQSGDGGSAFAIIGLVLGYLVVAGWVIGLLIATILGVGFFAFFFPWLS